MRARGERGIPELGHHPAGHIEDPDPDGGEIGPPLPSGHRDPEPGHPQEWIGGSPEESQAPGWHPSGNPRIRNPDSQ